VFFFQAEDGIRDATVTGVQTCALPISHHGFLWQLRRAPYPRGAAACVFERQPAFRPHRRSRAALPPVLRIQNLAWKSLSLTRPEIGRASCRERVLMWAVWIVGTRRRGK